jgi:leucyl aminopeptidase
MSSRISNLAATVVTAPLGQLDTPLLAVALPQGSGVPPTLAEFDRATGGVVARALASADFKGKRDETALLYPAGLTPGRILLVGLGKGTDVTRNSLRRAAAVAGKRARALGVRQFTFAAPPEARAGVTPRELGQVAVEGAAQGAWAFTELKAAPDEPRVEVEAVAVACASVEAREVEAGVRMGSAVAAGHGLARFLQIQPGNVCTPSFLADQARRLAETHGFTVTVLDRAGLRAEGMGALLAVAQGSAEEPRFIVLQYAGAGDAAPVALVGKGVTFDAGGISIKPAQNMEEMKFDMSGAAAVLGTFEVLGRLRPAVNVVGLVPATENLPSGTALKPGDVITSHLGKTIEIINTDAEGRLILCDALSYVRRFRPAAVLDIATLTGAVVVALGHAAIGVMGNDDALVAEVRDAGERAGERCWPLPLWDDYRELLKSDIADLKNSAGRGAGTIVGGWFLREFANGYPWAHLDIAGTAYTDSEGPHQAKGPTAVGVRLFTEFLLTRAGA